MRRGYILLLFFLSVCYHPSWAANSAGILEATVGVEKYIGIVEGYAEIVDDADLEKTQWLRDESWKVNQRWWVYYISIENLALNNDDLLSRVAYFNNLLKEVDDVIEQRIKLFKQKDEYEVGVQSLQGFLEQYKEIEEDATMLSMSDKTADSLAKLKAQEEILFTEVSSLFNSLKSTSAEISQIDENLDAEQAEEIFMQITIMSERIKGVEYVPILDRIKEYLYSLAAVAMLLMFLNMVQTKISAAKALKESAQQMAKLRGQTDERPEI